ncbi:MAG: NCS2 family permease [Thermodesulfobacteriota bacterium]|nr:NCS2 family permease [Thermodesulfobacteriota bacterium]
MPKTKIAPYRQQERGTMAGFSVDSYFKFRERNTNLKTEIRAGITTFLMMAYIIVVNPGILSNGGMPFSGVLFATVLVCALSSIAMGLYANLPYSLAPGMGINAFFTFSLIIGMGVAWQTALGAVFISGIIFIILSVTGVRSEIVRAVPQPLRLGLAAGIGLFLALIGLKSAGFIVAHPATLVGFGGLTPITVLFITGFMVTAALMLRKIPGALILGIAFTSVAALLISAAGTSAGWLETPLVKMPEAVFALPSLDVFLQMDIAGALSMGMIMPILSLLFVDIFDSIASFMGIAEVAGLTEEDGTPINMDKALLVDAVSTTLSGLAGSSSGTVYVESAAGIEEGGRTGMTALVAGLLFLPFMFLSPLLSFVPAVATAPVLVLVGVFMAHPLKNIDWKLFDDAIPAFLAVVLIPLTFSISQGVIWSFLAYTFLKLIMGKGREIHWMLYIIDVFAVITVVLPAA